MLDVVCARVTNLHVPNLYVRESERAREGEKRLGWGRGGDERMRDYLE